MIIPCSPEGFERPNFNYEKTNDPITGLRRNASYLKDSLLELAKGKKFILELGLNDGDGSTWIFNQAKPDLHIGVDYFPLFKDAPLTVQQEACKSQKNLQKTSLGMFYPDNPNFHFVQGNTRRRKTVRKCLKICKDSRPDLFFIDTLHKPDHLQKELKIWKKMITEQTTLIFHDTMDSFWDGSYECHCQESDLCDVIRGWCKKNDFSYDFSIKVGRGIGVAKKL